MEEDIALVVLEHLGDKLDVHVLNVDLLLKIRSRNTFERSVTNLETLIQ